jgi:hypothetical protein
VSAGREVKFSFVQIGGSQVMSSIDQNAIVPHALDFATDVRRGITAVVKASLASYDAIDRPAGSIFVDLTGAKDDLALLMQMRRTALTRLAGFNFVIGHADQFNIPASMNANAIVDRLNSVVATLAAAVSRCVEEPKQSRDFSNSVAGLDIRIDEFPSRRN